MNRYLALPSTSADFLSLEKVAMSPLPLPPLPAHSRAVNEQAISRIVCGGQKDRKRLSSLLRKQPSDSSSFVPGYLRHLAEAQA